MMDVSGNDDSVTTHNYPVGGIDSELPPIIVNRMRSVPFGMTQENIYYNYYSYDQIRTTLNDILLQLDINLGTDTVEIIISYCTIVLWDECNKGQNIDCQIYSNDNNINYSILKRPNYADNSNVLCDTILLNDSVGDIDEHPNKYIFRYVLKWFGSQPTGGASIRIGIVSKEFAAPLDGKRNQGIGTYTLHIETKKKITNCGA